MTDPLARYGLIAIAKARRHKMTPSEKKRRAKPARWLYPWAAEERYAKTIRTWFRPMRDYVRSYLREHGAAIFRGDSGETATRVDETTGSSFNLMVRSLNYWLGQYVSDDPAQMFTSALYMGLGRIADSAFDFNGRQYDKSMRHSLGIEFPVNDSWWSDARENWAQTNYQIVRGDLRNYMRDVNRLTERAVTHGWTSDRLAREITALDEKALGSRARFIARDQMGKLNGEISQRRMEAAGLTMYEWSTSNDERVRDTHVVLNGKLCRWDDSSSFSEDGGRTWKRRPASWCHLHPGQDYQCRCTALAAWEELLGEADGVVAGEGYVDEPPSAHGSDVVQGFYKPSPLVETQLGIQQEEPATIQAALDRTNPDGSKDNCQNSVIAYEMQRRGYRVEAMPFPGKENASITNATSAFLARNTDYRRANGRGDLEARMLKSPVGSRFVVSHQLTNGRAGIGHDYIAERTASGMRFLDPQAGIPDASGFFTRVRPNSAGEQQINFMRIDNKILDPRRDFSGVLRASSGARRVDNSDTGITMDSMDDNLDFSEYVTDEQANALLGYDPSYQFPTTKRIHNDGRPMTREEAYEILKNSELITKPREEYGGPWHRVIGDLYEESEGYFDFAVYSYSSKQPIDPTYAFSYSVNKDTGQVSMRATAPIPEDDLKKLKAP